MDIDNLKLFVLAASQGNISAAGRQLGLAPAVASSKLAKLERQLATELLHRSTRKVVLSLEGEEFLPYAKEILSQHESALEALGLGTSEPTGTLRFAAPSSFAQCYLMPIFAQFLERYPKVNLDLKLSDTRFDLIEGSFDLALRNQALTDSSLRARKLATDTRVLCASPDYIARFGLPSHPDELQQHQLIGFQTRSSKKLAHPDGELSNLPLSQQNCRLVLDDGHSLKLATLAGIGISANALWSVHRELADGSLVAVLPGYQLADNSALWLVYPKANVLSAKVRVLIDFLIEMLPQSASWQALEQYQWQL